MFLVELKTLIVEALRSTFDADYPDDRFKNIWTSIEYPADKANYPGIWVDFTPAGPVTSSGLDREEYADPLDPDNVAYPIARFNYAGTVSMTVVALTSLERDSLVDEVTKIISFGDMHQDYADFRLQLETNDLINIRARWDQFDIGGNAETPGTPWDTSEIIYENTISMYVEGDFAYLPSLGELVLLSQIVTYPYTIPPGDPTTGGGWQ